MMDRGQINDLGGSVYYDALFADAVNDELVYVSLGSYPNIVKKVAKEFNKRGFLRNANYRNYKIVPKYNITTKSNMDFAHLVAVKKDIVEYNNEGDEVNVKCYIFCNKREELMDEVYKRLIKYSSIPLIEEWKEFLFNSLLEYRKLYELRRVCNKEGVCGYALSFDKRTIEAIVREGLEEHSIDIKGSNKESQIMKGINGIDSYLSIFGEQLAKKIQRSFHPLFNPATDKYDKFLDYIDDYIYDEANKELYLGQKTIIQAVKKSLDVNKSTFLIAEMGSGKTLMGANIPYVHHADRNSGYNTIVMCPSHLVNVWEREVNETVPNSKTYIIKDIEDLIELKDRLTNKNKIENTYIIMSKESARNGYLKRPAAVWSKHRKCFVCPDCGKPLYYVKKGEIFYLTELDMLTENSINAVCPNKIYVKKEDDVSVEINCNAKLWQPLEPNGCDNWVKLGTHGYIMKEHLQSVKDSLDNKQNKTTKEKALYKRLVEEMTKIEEGDYKDISGYRRYSIAKYIKEHMKNVFDYCIIDECHEMKGLTEQGQAAANLIDSSKKSLLLTGTLLNGYASGIYYLLWRTSPHNMVEEGFTFRQEDAFTELYGATSKESSYSLTVAGNRAKKLNTSTKKLPGISPIVFTKFLSDKAAFLSLGDMAAGLPNYEEIPVGIPLDAELQEGYRQFEQAFTDYLRNNAFEKGGLKYTRAFLQNMSIYLNAPHIPIAIKDDMGVDLYNSKVLNKVNDRNKEKELLKIVKEKLSKGEKVLVYYSWVNRTDCAERLLKLFKDNNIKAFEMKSTTATNEREEWIDKHLEKGMQVMICNPKLVETGLTLLDFTTLIFYQMGYDLFTTRQASRRSWRLSQDKDVEVYFMYYKNTIEEQTLSLMASKLQASMALEGNFSEEGLKAMSDNEDTLTKIANNVVEGIKDTVDKDIFKATAFIRKERGEHRVHNHKAKIFKSPMNEKGEHSIFKLSKYKDIEKRKAIELNEDYLNNPIRLFV